MVSLHKKHVEKLEKVQRRVTKFILKTEDCYDSHLKKLNLLSMEKRRLLTDVTLLYKVLHGLFDIDIERYVDFHKETDRFSFRQWWVNSSDEICKNKYS